MTEMVERVARALYEGREADYPQRIRVRWESASDLQRAHSIDLARFAIAAMREPTEAMLQGACESHRPGAPMGKSPTSTEECPRIRSRRTIWRSMIDSALSPAERS